MGEKTGIIRYNIKERGRKLIGQERNFNVQKIVSLANSERIQERVKSGDMIGFLGHGVRQKYGVEPPEMVIHGGVPVVIPPAFKTIHLKAYNNGDIEHEAEFFDTEMGRAALEWFKAKTGGFSSVVTPSENNPVDWHGFDFVRIPNYDTNRGYVMDAISFGSEDNHLTSKQKFAVAEARMLETQAVLDSVLAMNAVNLGSLEKLKESNKLLSESLLSMEKELSARNGVFSRPLKLSARDSWLTESVVLFDSAVKGGLIKDCNESVKSDDFEFDFMSRL